MATYTIYFLDDRKVIVSFDLVECADDHEAWSHAPRLLKVRTGSRNVEIYEGSRAWCHRPPGFRSPSVRPRTAKASAPRRRYRRQARSQRPRYSTWPDLRSFGPPPKRSTRAASHQISTAPLSGARRKARQPAAKASASVGHC